MWWADAAFARVEAIDWKERWECLECRAWGGDYLLLLRGGGGGSRRSHGWHYLFWIGLIWFNWLIGGPWWILWLSNHINTLFLVPARADDFGEVSRSGARDQAQEEDTRRLCKRRLHEKKECHDQDSVRELWWGSFSSKILLGQWWDALWWYQLTYIHKTSRRISIQIQKRNNF